MTEVWPAVLWAALKLPLRCRLLLIGERDRKADAPSFMPAAAWLVKELSLAKWTEPNVDGPARRFATRLLGYEREREEQNKGTDKRTSHLIFDSLRKCNVITAVLEHVRLWTYFRLWQWDWMCVWRTNYCCLSVNSFFQLTDEVCGLSRRLPLGVSNCEVHQGQLCLPVLCLLVNRCLCLPFWHPLQKDERK